MDQSSDPHPMTQLIGSSSQGAAGMPAAGGIANVVGRAITDSGLPKEQTANDAAKEGKSKGPPMQMGKGEGPLKCPPSKGKGKGPPMPSGKGKGPLKCPPSKGKGKGPPMPSGPTPNRPEKNEWVSLEYGRLRWKRVLKGGKRWAGSIWETVGEEPVDEAAMREMLTIQEQDQQKAISNTAPLLERRVKTWNDDIFGGKIFEMPQDKEWNMCVIDLSVIAWYWRPRLDLLEHALRTFEFAKLLDHPQVWDVCGALERLMKFISIVTPQGWDVLQNGISERTVNSTTVSLDPRVDLLARIGAIPQGAVRLDVMRIYASVRSELDRLSSRVLQVRAAISAVRCSSVIPTLLGKLLHLGNCLNAGTPSLNRADGFDVLQALDMFVERQGVEGVEKKVLKHLQAKEITASMQQQLWELVDQLEAFLPGKFSVVTSSIWNDPDICIFRNETDCLHNSLDLAGGLIQKIEVAYKQNLDAAFLALVSAFQALRTSLDDLRSNVTFAEEELLLFLRFFSCAGSYGDCYKSASASAVLMKVALFAKSLLPEADRMSQFRHALSKAYDVGTSEAVAAALAEFANVDAWRIDAVKQEFKNASESAGVSVAYLLSDEFLHLAQSCSKKTNPCFYELKDVFFFGQEAIGRDRICPRDGRNGCAFIDTLPAQHRQRCTHFLSWTWSYTLETVRDGLRRWVCHEDLDPEKTFIFMCFFANNQYRILVDQTQNGSDNLELIFESRLQKIGKVVALLDTWDHSIYLRRIWTIFEQYTATKLNIPVSIILPMESSDTLIGKFKLGEEGILQVKAAFCNVDAETAEAKMKKDEEKVKNMISSSIGFQAVNVAVKRSMAKWVAQEIKVYMTGLVLDQPEEAYGNDAVGLEV